MNNVRLFKLSDVLYHRFFDNSQIFFSFLFWVFPQLFWKVKTIIHYITLCTLYRRTCIHTLQNHVLTYYAILTLRLKSLLFIIIYIFRIQYKALIRFVRSVDFVMNNTIFTLNSMVNLELFEFINWQRKYKTVRTTLLYEFEMFINSPTKSNFFLKLSLEFNSSFILKSEYAKIKMNNKQCRSTRVVLCIANDGSPDHQKQYTASCNEK